MTHRREIGVEYAAFLAASTSCTKTPARATNDELNTPREAIPTFQAKAVEHEAPQRADQPRQVRRRWLRTGPAREDEAGLPLVVPSETHRISKGVLL